MSPWRRAPGPGRADLAALARAGLALLALGLLGLLLAGASGCALTPPCSCPLGSYPRDGDTRGTLEGGGTARGDLPSQSVTAGGTLKGTGSTDCKCAPLCPRNQLLWAREEQGKSREVKCLPERCPDAPPPANTSKLPPQGP